MHKSRNKSINIDRGAEINKEKAESNIQRMHMYLHFFLIVSTLPRFFLKDFLLILVATKFASNDRTSGGSEGLEPQSPTGSFEEGGRGRRKKKKGIRRWRDPSFSS
jgi:hypothetical protein